MRGGTRDDEGEEVTPAAAPAAPPPWPPRPWPPRPLEATFDQGEKEGYGIWLDPAIKDDPTYAEHWAGPQALRVTIEPERIVLERVED